MKKIWARDCDNILIIVFISKFKKVPLRDASRAPVCDYLWEYSLREWILPYCEPDFPCHSPCNKYYAILVCVTNKQFGD